MEVMMPSRAVSMPTTPKREYYQFSAPTSPSRLSQFFDDSFAASDGMNSGVAFRWEEKPGTPKSAPDVRVNDIGDDFAFDVSQDWETSSLSAEELFDGGVIKPLKPPPRLVAGISENVTSPRKKPSQSRKIIQGALSSRQKNKESDPFAVAARNATKSVAVVAAEAPQRGRGKGVNLSKSSSRRVTRSLSPLRDTQYPWEEREEETEQPHKANNSTLTPFTKSHKKWRLKDFFLFRSASEGRATEKDPLKKYSAAAFRYSSFRAIESPGSGAGLRRKGPVSAHELHYTVNRAVSEDLKKKTFLPYKQGILGRLAFNPAVHALANGFGFSRK